MEVDTVTKVQVEGVAVLTKKEVEEVVGASVVPGHRRLKVARYRRTRSS
jgi:hypothetical protein